MKVLHGVALFGEDLEPISSALRDGSERGTLLAMDRRVGIALSLALLGGACTRSKTEAAKDETTAAKPFDRRATCRGFAQEMAKTTYVLGGALAVGLSDERTAEKGAQMQPELAGASAQAGGEFFERCMAWPEEAVRCVGPFGGFNSECERILAAAMGDAVPPKDVAAGPAPKWAHTLPEKPDFLWLGSDGTAVIIVDWLGDEHEHRLIGLRDGKVLWERKERFSYWLVPWSDNLLVGSNAARLEAFDVATGETRWELTLPPVNEYGSTAWIRHAVATGDKLRVLDDDGRLFLVDPTRCGAPGKPARAKPCFVLEHRIETSFDDDARLSIGENGTLFVSGHEGMTALDAKWNTMFRATATDTVAAPMQSLPDGRVLLMLDDAMVVLDPGKCQGEFAASDSAVPPGCRSWRVPIPDLYEPGVSVIADGAVAINLEGFTIAYADGKPRWKSPTAASGAVMAVGNTVYAVSSGYEDDDPLALYALDSKDGTAKWRAPLPLVGESGLWAPDVVAAHAGSHLLVAYDSSVAMFAIEP